MNGFLAVALGGAIGASARYGVGLAMARISDAPGLYATLSVNIVGSAAMGAVMAWLVSKGQTDTANTLYLLLAVGVLGGFTTFSAFALEVVHMMNSGQTARWMAYSVASVVGSVVALLVAFNLVNRWVT